MSNAALDMDGAE